jgi:hypothetical protein
MSGRHAALRGVVTSVLLLGCRADELVSAALPTAQGSLDGHVALGAPDSHRLSAYFPCLAL